MKMRGALGFLGIIGVLLMLAGCVAIQHPGTVNADAPGFLEGVWHGFILPVSFIVSLFTEKVDVYSVPNSGALYNLGFVVGVLLLGIGARSSKRR